MADFSHSDHKATKTEESESFGPKLRAMALLALGGLSALGFSSCTENARAKRFGGTMTVELEPGEKLLEVTWKDDQLWYLSRPMKEGEEAETYKFKEKSGMGLVEGTVKFIEKEAGSK